MRRVRQNVELLAEGLRAIGYEFSTTPHRPPDAGTPRELDELEEAVGTLPLSLRLFYEEVGAVDFSQSSRQLVQGVEPGRRGSVAPLRLLGEEAPLYVAPVGRLLEQAENDAFRYDGRRYLWIAPDECGRAGYSNGDDCHVMVPEAGVDFRWVEMRDPSDEHSEFVWFVDLLRQSFDGCGFYGRTQFEADYVREPPSLPEFEKLKTQLVTI